MRDAIAVPTLIPKLLTVDRAALASGGTDPPPLRGIWVTDADHVFVVGDQVALQYGANGCPTYPGGPMPSAPYYLTKVWATEPSFVVAVGSSDPSRCGPSSASTAALTGQIVELDFSGDPAAPKAKPMSMAPSPPLCAIWGDSTTGVMYAVGEQGTILRFVP